MASDTAISRTGKIVDNDFFHDRSQAIRRHANPADFDLPEQYFLFVGAFTEEKNIDGLIYAYLAYRAGGGRWSLVLAGDGPERRKLEVLAASSGFTRDIYFTGARSEAERPQYYAFAGCFVLPSTREAWGLEANEAMAAGLPVIVSRACGCAQDLLREGENGCSFDPDLPGDLAGCLRAVSALGADSLLDMGCCSMAIIARFSPEARTAEATRIAQF